CPLHLHHRQCFLSLLPSCALHPQIPLNHTPRIPHPLIPLLPQCPLHLHHRQCFLSLLPSCALHPQIPLNHTPRIPHPLFSQPPLYISPSTMPASSSPPPMFPEKKP
ncbi:hypothetical protein L211DRAFT_890861, partial [Terfezia boudieri ATCC MYA-4762]